MTRHQDPLRDEGAELKDAGDPQTLLEHERMKWGLYGKLGDKDHAPVVVAALAAGSLVVLLLLSVAFGGADRMELVKAFSYSLLAVMAYIFGTSSGAGRR